MKTKRHRRLHGLERDGAPSILNACYRDVSIDTDHRTQLTVDRGSRWRACLYVRRIRRESRCATISKLYPARKESRRSIDRSFGDPISRWDVCAFRRSRDVHTALPASAMRLHTSAIKGLISRNYRTSKSQCANNRLCNHCERTVIRNRYIRRL